MTIVNNLGGHKAHVVFNILKVAGEGKIESMLSVVLE